MLTLLELHTARLTREQLGELGDRVVSVPNELEDVDALAGAGLGLFAFELAVGAGDRHPFAGAHPQQVDFELGEGGEDIEDPPADNRA